jgi:hypothetical protein
MENDNELWVALDAAWKRRGLSPTMWQRKAALDYFRSLLSIGYRVSADTADLAVRAQAGRLAGKAVPLEDPLWKAP